jgi:hypothetical protein
MEIQKHVTWAGHIDAVEASRENMARAYDCVRSDLSILKPKYNSSLHFLLLTNDPVVSLAGDLASVVTQRLIVCKQEKR